jgi:hypothetical protein
MKGAVDGCFQHRYVGNISAINDAGNYEFNYICGITEMM